MHWFDVLLVWNISIFYFHLFLFLLLFFSLFASLGFVEAFFPPVLQSTFPEQPQEPSYIKLQHKDDVRIMNPHLHRHLYSDLPGYKLGRSSGILSRGFHGKLRLLQLLSRFCYFLHACVCMCVRVCVYMCVCACVYMCVHVHICSARWSLVTTWFLRSTLALFLSQYMMSVYAKWSRNAQAVSILAEDTVWHMN